MNGPTTTSTRVSWTACSRNYSTRSEQGLAVDGGLDCLEGGEALAAAGVEGRADAGVEVAAPIGSKSPLVTFRKTVEGRMSRSEPLLVGGTSRSVMKVNRLSRSLP